MAAAALDAQLAAANSSAPPVAAAALSLISDARLYRPRTVLRLADTALRAHRPSTRPFWDAAEQVALAAYHVFDSRTAAQFVRRILDRFPNSSRARLLQAISHESQLIWVDAARAYIRITDADPLFKPAYKRQVALLKSQFKLSEAATLLHDYLNKFATDFDAWAELCALDLQLGRFAHAIFAANELLLLDPHNHAAHTVVADVYATLGGVHNLCLARKHYAASLSMRAASNLRALYGLWLVCATLLDGRLLKDDRDLQVTLRLFRVARKGITAVYRNPTAQSGAVFVANTLGMSVYTGEKRVLKE